MGFITNTSSNISVDNSNDNLSQVAYNSHSGIVVSCTITTITIDSSASAVDDVYNNCLIEITSGIGLGTMREILDYDGASKTLTVEPLGELPDSESTFVIHRNSGLLCVQSQVSRRFTAKLPSHMSSEDNFYKGQIIRIVHFDGNNDTRYIKSYDGQNRIATINKEWGIIINEGDKFIISGESGMASAGTTNTITLDGKQSNCVVPGLVIEITEGTGDDQSRMISSISGNVITVDSDWTTVPDSTSEYRIYGGWMGSFESTDGYSQISYILSIDKSEKCLVNSILSSTESKNKGMFSSKEVYDNSKVNHNFKCTSNYYKLFIISMGTTLTGYIQTTKDLITGGESKSIGDFVNNSTDCTIVRSVITGRSIDNSAYKNINTDSFGNLNVNVMSPIDVFGHLIVAEPKILYEMRFPYSTTHLLHDYFMSGTALLANQGNGLLTAMTYLPPMSPASGSTARLKSVHRSFYSSGLSLDITFSAIFSDPVDGCTQIIGHGDECNGLFFGYDGLKFGTLRRFGGKNEIRNINITNGATSTGNLVVTLNGIPNNVPVVAGDSIQVVTKKIIDGVLVPPFYVQKEYCYSPPGWLCFQKDSETAYFISESAEPLTGTFSVSGQGVVGSFTQVQAGVAPTNDWTYVSNWTIDRLDGTVALPVIDFAKGNVFQISFQWLGFGNIVFKIENPNSSKFSPVNVVKYPNSMTQPSLSVPHQPLMLEASNGATTGFVSVSSASMTAHTLGRDNINSNFRFGFSEIKKQSVTGNKLYNIMTLYNSPVIDNTINIISMMGLTIASSWKANSSSIFHVLVNSKMENLYSLTIDNAGTGYSENTIYTTTGGSGTGISVKVLTVGGSGEITSLRLEVPGSGYAEGDVLAIDGGIGGAVIVGHESLTWAPRKYPVSPAYVCTDFVEVSGGEKNFSIAMGNNASFFETFNQMEIFMPGSYTMTLAIQPVADEVDAEFSSSFYWSEKV